MSDPAGWITWLRVRGTGPDLSPAPARGGRLPSYSACPHCTNTDTLSLHCSDDRCGWATCTCGAFIYSSRRHRHPRHGSGYDTCHDPAAAA